MANKTEIRVRPSKLPLVMLCGQAAHHPGSKLSSRAADRGTTLHKWGAALLQGVMHLEVPAEQRAFCEAMVEAGALPPLPDPEKDWPVVEYYVNQVGLLDPENGTAYIEEELDMTWLGMPSYVDEDGVFQQVGKLDFASYDPEHKFLTVADLKTGVAKVYAPKENWQVISYWLTKKRKLEAEGKPVEGGLLCIVKPEGIGGPKTLKDLVDMAQVATWEAELLAGVANAKGTDPAPTCEPGWWCRQFFCPAALVAGKCQAFEGWQQTKGEAKNEAKSQEAALAVAGFEPIQVEPDKLLIEMLRNPGGIMVLSADSVARAKDLEKQALTITINSQEEQERAKALLIEITKFEGQVDRNREDVKAPINKLGKGVDAAFRTGLTPLGTGKEAVKKKVAAWDKKVAEAAEAARLKAEADAKAAREAQAKAEQAQRDAEEAARKALREAAASNDKAAQEEVARKAAEAQAESLRQQTELAEFTRKAQQQEQEAQEAKARLEASRKGVSTGTAIDKIEFPDKSKVPLQYLEVNEQGVKAAIRSKVLTGKEPWMVCTFKNTVQSRGGK